MCQGLKNHQNNIRSCPLKLHASRKMGDPEVTKCKRQFYIAIILTKKNKSHKTKTFWLMGLTRPVGWRYFSSSHQEALAEEMALEQKPE